MARILAIDPGCDDSAFVVYDSDTRTVLWKDKCSNGAALDCFRGGFEIFGGDGALMFTVAAIEFPACYGMRVGREIFKTCFWAGRFAEALMRRGIDVHLVERPDVKLHLCRHRGAKDADVRAKLIDLFGPGKQKAVGVKKKQGPLYGVVKDMMQALALAVAFPHLAATAITLADIEQHRKETA